MGDDNLELRLSSTPTPSSPPPVAVTDPVQVSPAQALLYESPTSHPLQLSPNLSLYNAVFASEASSSGPLLHPPPEELAFSPSPKDVPGSGVIAGGVPSRTIRHRKNSTNAPREGKSETIEPPYPWATNHRATVHELQHLLSNGIRTITGEVQCKRCERQYKMEYDLEEKFKEIGSYIALNKHSMHDRAPSVWRNPVLPRCRFCGQENCAKLVLSGKKRAINWLFLLLGQMIGRLLHSRTAQVFLQTHQDCQRSRYLHRLSLSLQATPSYWPFQSIFLMVSRDRIDSRKISYYLGTYIKLLR
ncbi:hypothetical protein F3Y22_tig00116944pilonHSYRG00269 [Hibiscus syriacus]|uniref:DUF7086 domain-containing protein n=1 Tax=Hibiscus syriacus TaxID=106335 RepID=A0A6A2X1U0_HIBSY|nr:hypothetical protein F3Y22_tig00116944pilonHSYRG00269 [Hibiscus syriacus]